MRRELLVFAVEPPLRTVEADTDVAALVTVLAQGGAEVEAAFPSEDGEELAVVVRLEDDAPEPDVAAAAPRLRLRTRRVHRRAPRHVVAPPVPPLVEPDGTAVVAYLRRLVHRLHRVDVAGSPATGLRITVLLGRPPGVDHGGPVPAVGIAERTRVRLPFPVS